MKVILLLMFVVQLSYANSSKPFWTEKASYEEGDKTFFIGTYSKAPSLEVGREKAFEGARNELMNHYQVSDTHELEMHTQMNYEEQNADGTYNVYRLLWVDNRDAEKLKGRLMLPKDEPMTPTIIPKVIQQMIYYPVDMSQQRLEDTAKEEKIADTNNYFTSKAKERLDKMQKDQERKRELANEKDQRTRELTKEKLNRERQLRQEKQARDRDLRKEKLAREKELRKEKLVRKRKHG